MTYASTAESGNSLPIQSRVDRDRPSSVASPGRSIKRDPAPSASDPARSDGLDKLTPLQVRDWSEGVRRASPRQRILRVAIQELEAGKARAAGHEEG